YLVRKPSGESCLSHKNTFFVAPTFDKDEDEARLRGVDPQAGPSAAKLIQQLGEQFAAHSNAAVAAAAEDLLDIAAPVLATDGTAQPCAMGSDRLMNALAT